jgi:flavodoxin short chain
MSKIAVVYWSGTGNTEAMAKKVAEGAKAAGADVSCFNVSEFNAGSIDNYNAIAFGCPAMGAEQLEDSEFEPVFEACLPKVKGKSIGLFGSYGWGEGDWMRSWEDTCRGAGAVLVSEGVIANGEPDSLAAVNCAKLGKALAEV